MNEIVKASFYVDACALYVCVSIQTLAYVFVKKYKLFAKRNAKTIFAHSVYKQKKKKKKLCQLRVFE